MITVEKFLNQPPPDTKVWRYMDLAQFMSVIHTESVFFTQVKRFEDSYEGSMRYLVEEKWVDDEFQADLIQAYQKNGMRVYCAALCWHMNSCESAAMWRLYLSNNQGIAIQTTIGRLNRAIQLEHKLQRLLKGEVLYTDTAPQPKAGDSEGQSGEIALFCKRPSFAHEREYRLVLWSPSQVDILEKNGGIALKSNLVDLIENIFIAPTAPVWIKPLLESILETKYGLQRKIYQSSLNETTLW